MTDTTDHIRTLNYKYSPTFTAAKMHQFFQKYWGELNIPMIIGCLGPPESGKSVAVIQMLNMVKWAMPEVKNRTTGERERHSKIGICRDTTRQIRDGPYNTMKQGWFPVEFGRINNTTSGANAPIEGTLRVPKADGSTCVVQLQGIIFGDDVEGAKERLKSVEFTCVYANEIQSLPPDVLDILMERVGRYPGGEQGKSKAKLVIVDYNMPPEGSWCEHLHEDNAIYTESTPMGYKINHDLTLMGYNADTQKHDVRTGKVLDDVLHEGVNYIQMIFTQPPAALKIEVGKNRNGEPIYEYHANPNAEVPPHGRASPYPALIAQGINRGRQRDIERELCLLPVAAMDKKAVYGDQFDTASMVLTPYYPADPECFTLVGSDTSGNNPAMVIFQLTTYGWVQVMELCETDGTFKGLMDKLDEVSGDTPESKALFSKDRMLIVCDPANAKDTWTNLTPVQHLRNRGYCAITAKTNSIELRIDNARSRLLSAIEAGHNVRIPPHLYFSATCVNTVQALYRGHVYRRVMGQAEGSFSYRPNKHTKYSHYADSFEYAALQLSTLLLGDNLARTIDAIQRFRDKYNGAGNYTINIA